MSKVTRVVVLCPNGKRQTVNLTPNSSILQILEEVCEKQKINSDDFDICHYSKPLDLSLPIRFANLANNAQLELQPAKTARKDCHVSVALQLESGERIMKDFVPSTSVWEVVEHCLNMKSDEIKIDKKGEPVCIYMRQKLIGDSLKKTTLRGLGLTKGSAIIRLMYRNPDDLSDQAHVSTPLSKPVKEVPPTFPDRKISNTSNKMECDPPAEEQKTDPRINKETLSINTPSTSDNHHLKQDFLSTSKNMENMKCSQIRELDDAIEKNLDKVALAVNLSAPNDTVLTGTTKEVPQPTADHKMEFDSISTEQVSPEEEVGAIHYIGGRHAVVYSLDDISDVKKADLPDEFFDLTIEDVRYLMEEFKRTSSYLENQPLLTKELRNRQMLQKLGRFKETVIRIYFPERLVLQAVFEAQETVQDVCDFIRNYLEDPSLNFYLYTSPPKEKKDPTKTLIESMLIPASVVYIGSDSHNPCYLIKSLREKISDPRAASLAAYESRKQAISEIEEITELKELPSTSAEAVVEDKVPGPSYSQSSSHIQTTTQKAPKWLKLSKK